MGDEMMDCKPLIRQRGWTLLEASVVLAVIAALVGVAVSGIGNAIQAARALEARSALLSVLTTARSRAAYLEADVGFCPSLDGKNCAASFRWESGWIAYADRNGSGRLDPSDPIIARRGPLGAGVAIATSSGRKLLEFQPAGTNGGSNATFTICDRRGRAKATAIAMGNIGTYRTVKPTRAGLDAACAVD